MLRFLVGLLGRMCESRPVSGNRMDSKQGVIYDRQKRRRKTEGKKTLEEVIYTMNEKRKGKKR